MRGLTIAALALVAVVLSFLQLSGARAQPELTLIFPEDGDVLAEPPRIIHMCFASPVNIRDPDAGGDFRFRVIMPDDNSLGLRIVFQPDGLGVDIHPGIPDPPPEGEWTFEWRVTDPDTLEPATGTVSFTVTPDGSPAPTEPPERCNGTTTPTPVGTPSPTPAPSEGDGDEDQDILFLALITTGSAIGAAVLGLILYLFRRRIGFWLHRPAPPRGEGDSEEH